MKDVHISISVIYNNNIHKKQKKFWHYKKK